MKRPKLSTVAKIIGISLLTAAFCGNAFAVVVGKPRKVYNTKNYQVKKTPGKADAGKAGYVGETDFSGKVLAVTSGDSFTVDKLDHSAQLECILCGVAADDSPEAKKTLEELVLGKTVRVSWKDKSIKQKRSKRTYYYKGDYIHYYLVQITANVDGRQIDIGGEMIKRGYGRHVPEETAKLMTTYDAAERKARTSKVGMWGAGSSPDAD